LVSGDIVVNNAAEKLGFALVVAFLWFVWPPLCLLGAGLLLIVWANVRAARASAGPPRVVTALAAAWRSFTAAYRAAREAQQPAELRRVA
jgi:hypothetical protein